MYTYIYIDMYINMYTRAFRHSDNPFANSSLCGGMMIEFVRFCVTTSAFGCQGVRRAKHESKHGAF